MEQDKITVERRKGKHLTRDERIVIERPESNAPPPPKLERGNSRVRQYKNAIEHVFLCRGGLIIEHRGGTISDN